MVTDAYQMNQDHESTGVIAGVCFLVVGFLVGTAVLTSCVEHRVTSPQLDIALNKLAGMQQPIKCPTLDLPPIPDRVQVNIRGDNITADAGGETILRGYVACRSLYSPPVK